jgi:hypothetical protein
MSSIEAYWHNHSSEADSVFFIVVSGTSFLQHRARAVRCTWAPRARNVLLVSGKREDFSDSCSKAAGSNSLPEWHAVHRALPLSSAKHLTSRALLHDDFFSSVPKFMLSLSMAWQLNASADWYFLAGCDTAVHPIALADALKGINPADAVVVGGHAGATALLRSNLFLSGGSGLALSRAAVALLLSKIEDFTEMWLLHEGAAAKCIPCADIALQRLCEREGILIIELEGFYAYPPSHYLGSSVLLPSFSSLFPWQHRLSQCFSALHQGVQLQTSIDALQSIDGRWGRSFSMSAPPIAFHYLGPRRMHQTWRLLQSLHAMASEGLC